VTIFFIGGYKQRPTTGGHLYHLKMIEALKEMSYDITIISFHKLPKFFKCRPISFVYPLLLCVKRKPCLIIQVSDTGLRYLLFSFFTEIFNIPVMQIVHHIKETLQKTTLKSRLKLICIKYNFRKAKSIIVNSMHTKLDVIKLVGAKSEERIFIVNPGIERRFEGGGKRAFRNKKSWKFLSVGAVIERKGYHYLIDALRNLNDIPFKCYIVGNIDDKKYYSLLLEKVQTYKLEEKVKFTGYISYRKLLEFYDKTDIFILPSLHEGYGIVLCEAICQGLPIIATNVGAVPEIIEDRGTGLLVEPKNAKSIVSAVRRMVSNPELAETLSQNAIEKCGYLNRWDKMKESIKNVIKSNVKKNDLNLSPYHMSF